MRWILVCLLAACSSDPAMMVGDGGGGGDDDAGGGSDGGGGGGDCSTEVRAFPCAEGWGASAQGGRGGQVIHVTTLAADGPGSLQEAVTTDGPRIVVFDVSGVIDGDINITHGRLTIAGQTAPGAGITIRGQLTTEYDPPEAITDLIVRHVRVRPPPLSGVSSDALQFSQNDLFILDHVTASWGSDETIESYSGTGMTIQWSTIEESDTEGHPEGEHNYGFISGPDGGHVTIHHTLFAHHKHRLPAIANGPSDVRNNVLYDFRQAFHHDNTPNDGGFNVVGNYYKVGPSEDDPVCFNLEDPARYYFKDNWVPEAGVIQDPCAESASSPCLDYGSCGGEIVGSPFDTPPVATDSPEVAYQRVLARAGAFPRDVVSRRTIDEVENGTGSWGRHEPGDLMEGLTPGSLPSDGDGDGMADDWESAHGLDPQDPSDATSVTGTGYTAIEDYINELADRLVD